MFKHFLTALLEKMTSHLVKHPDFFKSEKREMEHLSVPASFKKYLETVSENHFMKDLEVIVTFIKSPKSAQIKKNEFFKAFTVFLTEELARKVDHLNSEFYLLQKDERVEVIEKLLPGESALAKSLRNILTDYTYQQFASEAINIGHRVIETPFVVVQSPREIGTELKREIRTQLTEKYPLCFPFFQINRKLIGGIRIFHNGQTLDHSWLSRVLSFTSLTTA